jgi:hypothetical protein
VTRPDEFIQLARLLGLSNKELDRLLASLGMSAAAVLTMWPLVRDRGLYGLAVSIGRELWKLRRLFGF